MKYLQTIASRLCLVAAMAFPWTTAEALEAFEKAGVISRVNAATVNIYHQDIDFRIRRSTEIRVPDVSKPSMRDFKAGNGVYLRGEILDGVYYVDVIVLLPESKG